GDDLRGGAPARTGNHSKRPESRECGIDRRFRLIGGARGCAAHACGIGAAGTGRRAAAPGGCAHAVVPSPRRAGAAVGSAAGSRRDAPGQPAAQRNRARRRGRDRSGGRCHAPDDMQPADDGRRARLRAWPGHRAEAGRAHGLAAGDARIGPTGLLRAALVAPRLTPPAHLADPRAVEPVVPWVVPPVRKSIGDRRNPGMIEDVRYLIVFAKVAEAGSFTAGAKALGMSTAATSQYVSRLEKNLGIPLFYRSTRRLSLTFQGAQVLQTAQEMLRLYEDGVVQLKTRPKIG